MLAYYLIKAKGHRLKILKKRCKKLKTLKIR